MKLPHFTYGSLLLSFCPVLPSSFIHLSNINPVSFRITCKPMYLKMNNNMEVTFFWCQDMTSDQILTTLFFTELQVGKFVKIHEKIRILTFLGKSSITITKSKKSFFVKN